VVSTKHKINISNGKKCIGVLASFTLGNKKKNRRMGVSKNIHLMFRRELINPEIATINDIFPFSYFVGNMCRRILI